MIFIDQPPYALWFDPERFVTKKRTQVVTAFFDAPN